MECATKYRPLFFLLYVGQCSEVVFAGFASATPLSRTNVRTNVAFSGLGRGGGHS